MLRPGDEDRSGSALAALPKRRRLNPWLRLLGVWALIAGVSFLLLRIPIPALDEMPAVRNLVVVAGAVVLAGKVLYDTLFYERYPV